MIIGGSRLKHWVSTENNYWRMMDIADLEPSSDTLELTDNKKQTVLGFGGCFNELGWDALMKVDESEREGFLDALFSPDNCRFNYGRVPIGANDFSLEWYSCDEIDGDFELEHFSIERDKQYTLPFVNEAKKRSPELSLFASPWSPPIWMKTKKAHNFGRIKMEKQYLEAYAQYFVKFVKAYQEQGIMVSQVHVQNEPMADQKFPSCLWYGEDMLVFIRDYLGPAFEKAGMSTELWLGTINGPFMDFMMGPQTSFGEFYDQFPNTILSDEKARHYLTGVGLQWGGKHVMEQIETSFPMMRLMQTESECGDGNNTWEHMEYIFTQMWFYFRHGAERYTYWNIALLEGGISTWGWRQNSLCTVNAQTKTLTLQPEFYLMKHFSHFVQPGATYLECKGRMTANCVAFENPDGSLVLVVGNSMHRDRKITFVQGEKSFTATILAHSINTFVI